MPVTLVKSFYAALAAGDVPAILKLFSTEISWREAEGFPYYSGTWTRPQQVVENLLAPLGSEWTGFSATPDRYVEDDGIIIVLGHYRGLYNQTSKAIDVPFAHEWTTEDGKVKTFVQHTDTALFRQAMN